MKRIILDTDLGCDCDDVYALALLASAHKAGDCILEAVTSSAPFPAAAGAIQSILDFFGLSGIPVAKLGSHEDGFYSEGADHYAQTLIDAFPASKVVFHDSVRLLRKCLAESREKISICVIGTLTNIASLLRSEGDDISPLDGVSLVRDKVSKLYIMGGDFSHVDSGKPAVAEWNIKLDIRAAQNVISCLPCPAAVIPFELGADVISGGRYVAKYGVTSPVSLAYITHGSADGRSSWDPITAYAAVYDGSEDFSRFLSPHRGDISVNADGTLDFRSDENARFEYFTSQCSAESLAAQIDKIILGE